MDDDAKDLDKDEEMEEDEDMLMDDPLTPGKSKKSKEPLFDEHASLDDMIDDELDEMDEDEYGDGEEEESW